MKILLIMLATILPPTANAVRLDLECTVPVGFDYGSIPIRRKKKSRW